MKTGCETVLERVAWIESQSFADAWTLKSITDMTIYDYNIIYVAYNGAYGRPECIRYQNYAGAACDVYGYLIADIIAEDSELLRIAVAEEYRGQGYGGALIRYYISDTDCAGYYLDVRESNVTAIRLYESLGYRLIGKREGYYTLPAEAAYLYKLDRTNS